MEPCTFCGEKAYKTDVCATNSEQRIYSCKKEQCLTQYRALVVQDRVQSIYGVNYAKKRSRRHSRQKTKLTK